MEPLKEKKPLNLDEFNKKAQAGETYFGLPGEIVFCKKCVMSNQRPNSTVEYKHTQDSKKNTLKISDDGICDACKLAERKQKDIDWKKRERQLMELCDKHRRKDGYYDCLVPGSGGKDSFYASHILKYKYGMNPLTVTWAPHIYTDWGWKNFQAWIHSGVDNVLFTPDGRTHRLFTRLAVENMLHPFQPFIIGQKAFAPRMAVKFNIPLVFYGESEAEYGNPIAEAFSAQQKAAFFTSDNYQELYFGGVSTPDLSKHFGVEEKDLNAYLPVRPEILAKTGVQVHYLGYYLKWHPQSCFYYAVEHGNFKPSPERTPGTYSKYNSIDDKIDDLHYYTTLIKFGIGRATYDAAQEIRSRDITRDEGVALVKRFDEEFPARFEDEIYEYLSINEKEFPKAYKMFEHPEMDKEYFQTLCDNFRSPHIWKNENGQWKLRQTVFSSPC
jgi:N-acetyl sugar amidotransferase